MIIKQIRWLPDVIEKLEVKHGVDLEEVEQIFINKPLLDVVQEGTARVNTSITLMVRQMMVVICLWYLSTN